MDTDSLLKPVIDNFKQGLAKIEKQTLDIKKDNERELNNTVKYNQSLKVQRDKNNKDVRLKLEELDHDIKESKFLQGQLQKETSYNVNLNNSLRSKMDKVTQTLLNAEAERDLALETRKKSEEVL